MQRGNRFLKSRRWFVVCLNECPAKERDRLVVEEKTLLALRKKEKEQEEVRAVEQENLYEVNFVMAGMSV